MGCSPAAPQLLPDPRCNHVAASAGHCSLRRRSAGACAAQGGGSPQRRHRASLLTQSEVAAGAATPQGIGCPQRMHHPCQHRWHGFGRGLVSRVKEVNHGHDEDG